MEIGLSSGTNKLIQIVSVGKHWEQVWVLLSSNNTDEIIHLEKRNYVFGLTWEDIQAVASN